MSGRRRHRSARRARAPVPAPPGRRACPRYARPGSRPSVRHQTGVFLLTMAAQRKRERTGLMGGRHWTRDARRRAGGMNAWMKWDQQIPGWQRYLWWVFIGGAVGAALSGFGTGCVLAIWVRLQKWSGHPLTVTQADDFEMTSMAVVISAAAVGMLAGWCVGLLTA